MRFIFSLKMNSSFITSRPVKIGIDFTTTEIQFSIKLLGSKTVMVKRVGCFFHSFIHIECVHYYELSLMLNVGTSMRLCS